MYNKTIALDFDGTIFKLFINYNLHLVVENLSNYLKQFQIHFSLNRDIFDVYKIMNSLDIDEKLKDKILLGIDKIMVAAEIDALKTGVIVDGFYEFIKYINNKNLPIAIITNNSTKCIYAFIEQYCKGLNCPIVGRQAKHPERMKPNTYMLNELSSIMGIKKEELLFIGDNPRDYECAMSYGCEFIGLTPTVKKRNRMITKANDIKIMDDFYQLIDYLG